jgi:hypothetical protein
MKDVVRNIPKHLANAPQFVYLREKEMIKGIQEFRKLNEKAVANIVDASIMIIETHDKEGNTVLTFSWPKKPPLPPIKIPAEPVQDHQADDNR